jgi:hypothetical protein
MASHDVKKERKDLYSCRADEFVEVDVPAMQFLMVDGHGDPNTAPEYAEAVEALYTASYGVRALAKKELDRVHTVGPLEGLWSAEDLETFRTRDKSAWDWTMMIVQPEWITGGLVQDALTTTHRKKGLAALDRVRFETFTEGRCVQVLHVGSYDDEGPTIARLHDEYLPAHGLELRGRHHEIYLSDPRKVEPARLRTILRQPVTGRGSGG